MSSAAIPAANVEHLIIHKLIESRQTVVDVSPGGAEWLHAVFSLHSDMRALFYASQDSEIAAFSSAAANQTQAVHQGSGDTEGADLDGDTLREGIRHIHYLHIGSGRAVRRVLKGATRLLSHSRIDFIQFPLDSFDIWTIQTINQLLVAFGYETFEIFHDGGETAVNLKFCNLQAPQKEHRTIQLLVMHQRLVPLIAILNGLDFEENYYRLFRNAFDLARKGGVQFRGFIQVGAHDGHHELDLCNIYGFRPALLIEANPVMFAKLSANFKGVPYATLANCAVLDKNGPIEFTITNHDQSSSLFKPNRAASQLVIAGQQVPIKQEHVITVPGKTLDHLLKERNLLPQWFNVLVMDIQGAELLALKGAPSLLPHVDMIYVEVNFEDLYEGGAQVDDIDDILAPYRFRRVYTSANHRFWADALYLKEQFAGNVKAEIPSCLSLLFGGNAPSS